MRFFLVIGFLALQFAFVCAQSPASDDSANTSSQKVSVESAKGQKSQSPSDKPAGSSGGRQTNESRRNINFIKRVSLPFRASLNKDQRLRLAPSAQLISKYDSFLRESGEASGLIKLFPDQGCENNAHIIRIDAACTNWIPNSAFYSFREKEYTVDYLSDITYKNNFLVTDGILAQGIIAAIGDVPLENVSLSVGGMKFLIDYQPAVQSREAVNQFIEIGRGLKIGGYEYRKAVPAFENMTYALRVIAYRGSFYSSYRGRLFDVLYGDKRRDLILAFRVLKKNEDGSITLLWKELDHRKSPKLVFPKKRKESADESLRKSNKS